MRDYSRVLDDKLTMQWQLDNAFKLGVMLGASQQRRETAYLDGYGDKPEKVERSHWQRYQKHLHKQFKRCVKGGKFHKK